MNILLVDDDPITGLLYQRALQRAGFTVQLIQEGVKASMLAQRQNPDLILLDTWFPDISVNKVLEDLVNCQSTSNIPIILLAANNTGVKSIKGLSRGVKNYWYKSEIVPSKVGSEVKSLFPNLPN